MSPPETAVAVDARDREIIYVGDPMCSWCWGIAPELDALLAAHPDIPLRVVVGGLRPGEYAEEVTEGVAASLEHHWVEVAKRSGQPFAHEVLGRRGWVYDTEPSCRAVVAMRHVDDALTFPFFKRLQRAFYAEGVVIADPAVFGDLVDEFDVDGAAFAEAYESKAVVQATWRDFSQARRWGISGFPTVVARQGEQGHLLAQGYATAADLDAALVRALDVTPSEEFCPPGEVC